MSVSYWGKRSKVRCWVFCNQSAGPWLSCNRSVWRVKRVTWSYGDPHKTSETWSKEVTRERCTACDGVTLQLQTCKVFWGDDRGGGSAFAFPLQGLAEHRQTRLLYFIHQRNPSYQEEKATADRRWSIASWQCLFLQDQVVKESPAVGIPVCINVLSFLWLGNGRIERIKASLAKTAVYSNYVLYLNLHIYILLYVCYISTEHQFHTHS